MSVAGKFQNKVQVWIYFTSSALDSPWFLVLKTLPERGAFWQPVTGSVEPGEKLEEAALRECIEETGLSFQGVPSPIGKSFEFLSRWGNRVQEYGFALQAKLDQPNGFPRVRLDGKEHSEFRWVRAEDALHLIQHFSNREIFNELLKSLRA